MVTPAGRRSFFLASGTAIAAARAAAATPFTSGRSCERRGDSLARYKGRHYRSGATGQGKRGPTFRLMEAPLLADIRVIRGRRGGTEGDPFHAGAVGCPLPLESTERSWNH